MATEPTSPRTGLIFKGAAIAIGTLIAVHGALVAYFDHFAQAEEQRKFGDMKPEALMSLRADEKERLHAGPVPIDRAMQELATRGRTANPAITPAASAKDLAPLQGWVKMPAEVPAAMSAAQPSAAPSAFTVDAGAAAVAPADAGVAPKLKPASPHPDRGPTPSNFPPKNP
jgi:hypothetical protein